MTWLDELEAKAKAATPGPWSYHDNEQDGPASYVYRQVLAKEMTGYDEEDDVHYQVCAMPNDSYGYASNFTDNGPFIAAANPEAILKLVRGYRAAIEALEFYEFPGAPRIGQSIPTELIEDGGNRAREALSLAREMGGSK